jgi:hypothetical protein
MTIEGKREPDQRYRDVGSAFLLQEVQPGLLGLMDGSVSTLAPTSPTRRSRVAMTARASINAPLAVLISWHPSGFIWTSPMEPIRCARRISSTSRSMTCAVASQRSPRIQT